MKWIKQAINRCKAKTPKIFRKVQYIAGALTTAMIAANAELINHDIVAPEWFSSVLPYMIGFSAGLVALSQFTQSYDSNGNPIHKLNSYEEESGGVLEEV